MLNDLIVIEKRIESPNGFKEFIWEKEISCWASKESTEIKETTYGNSQRNDIETVFKIRTSTKIKNMDTRNYRLIHKGNIHDIKYIIKDGRKEEFIKIKCKMVS